MSGLYIHVPFCQKRCHYCSFYSTTFGKKERDLYVHALKNEINERKNEINEHKNKINERKDKAKERANNTEDYHKDTLVHLNSVYFGGGTPSQLDKDELYEIFQTLHKHFDLSNAEITFECNPDDVTAEYAKTLAELGVNRVSMGVQSFNDATLKAINRRHTAAQVHDALQLFHKVGIHNISIDLIYGLPGQTLAAWEQDLAIAIALAQPHDKWNGQPAITHLSSYALSIEEGTHLYNMRARGELKEIDEETSLEMYNQLVDRLTEAGFEHYEISNFSLPGFHSRHNSSYWSGEPYLGVGPGAHSYDGICVRRWNDANLTSYIHSASAPHEKEHLTDKDLYNERIITRLRTREGLRTDTLSHEEKLFLMQQAKSYLAQGLLQMNDTHIALTRKGIFVSDSIFADLMMEV